MAEPRDPEGQSVNLGNLSTLLEIIAAVDKRVSISAEALGALAIHANHRGAVRSVNLRRFLLELHRA
jgi:hypothetical protein